jgi:hypothetical protein
VPKRFDVPFSTRGKRAVREKWQRSVPPNGNTNWNKTAVFPEIGNKIGNKHGNSEVLFPKNGNNNGNKTAVFPEIGNKIGNKHGNSEVLFPKNGNNNGNKTAVFPEIGNKIGNKTAVFPEIGNKIGNSEALFPSNNTLAAKNGSAWKDPAAKSGSKNGSSFHIPADINEWDRLTAALFYLRQFHWAVHHLFQPTKGEDKEQGKRPWCKA